MFKKILLGATVLIAVLLAVVMAQPATYHIERSIQIAAPPDVVWAEISDFRRWQAWDPWEKADPNQQTTIEGKPGSVGHKSSWDGEKTGTGAMTVIKATRPSHLGMKLEFVEPFESQATTALDLASEGDGDGDGVTITWSMDGENDFAGKFFALVMDMNEMIGTEYEKGLIDLKRIAEENARKQKDVESGSEPTSTNGSIGVEHPSVEGTNKA